MRTIILLFALLISTSVFAATVLPGYTINYLGTFDNNNPYGGLAADANNVYMVGGASSNVYKYNISSGTFTNFFSRSGHNLSLLIQGTDLYVGGSLGQIWKVNSSGSGTLFATVQTYVNTMVIAPAGWGSYGGQMIVATSSGIYALNMSTGVQTTIVGSGTWDGLAWNAANELVATQNSSEVSKIASNGTVSGFFSVGATVDSLVIHPGTGEIFTTSTTNIYRTNANGTGTTSFISGLNISGGWYPSGIAFSPNGATMYYSESNGGYYKLYSVTGFSSVAPVPEASTTLMLLLALCGVRMLKKKK